MAAQVALKRDTEDDNNVLAISSRCLPIFTQSQSQDRYGLPAREDAISDDGRHIFSFMNVFYCFSFSMCKHLKAVCVFNI